MPKLSNYTWQIGCANNSQATALELLDIQKYPPKTYTTGNGLHENHSDNLPVKWNQNSNFEGFAHTLSGFGWSRVNAGAAHLCFHLE